MEQIKEAAAECKTGFLVDLAPSQLLRQGRPFGSIFSEDNMEFYEQRDREFQWSNDPSKPLSVLETCGSKILIGSGTGEIKIFSIVDLQCKTVLSHPKLKSKVTCLHCICTEVIAGYDDACVCIWNVQSKNLTRRFCVGDRTSSIGYANLLRLQQPKLVVATVNGAIGIWNYENSCVKFVSQWQHTLYVRRMEIAGDSIIFMTLSDGVVVYNFDGTLVRKICNWKEVNDLGIYGDKVAIADKYCRIRIWDVNTGNFITERCGRGSEIFWVSANSSHLLTVDEIASVVIWSLEAILEGRPAALMKISDPSDSPEAGIQCCSFYSLGHNFFVRLDPSKSIIKVTDFL